jgi:hypothetical protein
MHLKFNAIASVKMQRVAVAVAVAVAVTTQAWWLQLSRNTRRVCSHMEVVIAANSSSILRVAIDEGVPNFLILGGIRR